MGIRAISQADLAITLEAPGEFGSPVTLTSDLGFSSAEPLHGMTQDIGLVIDPDIGVAVSGRLATTALRFSTITSVSGYASFPIGIADTTKKPWTLEFLEAPFAGQVWKIKKTAPDRKVDIVECELEAYNAGRTPGPDRQI